MDVALGRRSSTIPSLDDLFGHNFTWSEGKAEDSTRQSRQAQGDFSATVSFGLKEDILYRSIIAADCVPSPLVELFLPDYFSVLAMVTVNVLVTGMRSAKTIQRRFSIFEATPIMDQLTRAIEQNTIDYEAYYLRNVQGETG